MASLDNEGMNKQPDNRVTYLGHTNFRNQRQTFGIKRKDRRSHTYIIGKTVTGKSTLLENMIYQDILNGEGMAVLDPHGDFIDRMVEMFPEKRKPDLIYFNVPDPACPIGFNPLAAVPPYRRALMASGILESFKKIWDKTWGPRLEHILRNTLLTLLDQPQATLGDIRRLYYDDGFRREAVARVTNPQVKEFWTKEFAAYPVRYRAEAVLPILNKVGAFLADPNLQRVLMRPESTFDVRFMMDEGKILLVNLAKGKLGADISSLLGSLLVSQLGLAALSRADIPEKERRDFYLYLDEFQNFTTLSMASMLAELRKYRLSLILAHQYLGQVEPEIREAILGNAATIIAFRIGLLDARLLEKEFHPAFTELDLINLPNYSIYLKLMIDGTVSKPFSADTLPPSGGVVMAQPVVFSHWYSLLENLQHSPQDFYSLVEQAIATRKIPECAVSRIKASEGGLFSATREYLRVSRKEFNFDICGAPFGNGFFVSWWLGEKPSGCLAAFAEIPLLGLIFRRLIKPNTYYKIDTGLMFQEAVSKAVHDAVDQITTAKGIRALSELERKPILRDFYR